MKRTVFILGAGFSADAGIPMLRNFLRRMVEMPSDPRYRTQYDAEDKAALSQIQRMQQILEQSPFRSDEDGPDNIEALTSVVEFFHDKKLVYAPALNKLAHRTIELSTNLSGATCPRGWTAPTNFPISHPSAYHVFAAILSDWINNQPRSGELLTNVVISLNWDVVLERVLFDLGLWPDYFLDSNIWEETRELQDWPKIPILKIHGSLNWIIQDENRGKVLPFLPGSHCLDWNLIGGSSKSWLMVPPTSHKSPYESISMVWETALDYLKYAQKLIIIGYSMPESDPYFKHFLMAGLLDNKVLEEVRVYTGSNRTVKKRYETLFSRTSSFIFTGKKFDGFLREVISGQYVL